LSALTHLIPTAAAIVCALVAGRHVALAKQDDQDLVIAALLMAHTTGSPGSPSMRQDAMLAQDSFCFPNGDVTQLK
jgi:hypothetical protein